MCNSGGRRLQGDHQIKKERYFERCIQARKNTEDIQGLRTIYRNGKET